jgi:ankyrin repeat protein
VIKYTLIIGFLLLCTCVKAQTLNDKLAKAISDKDTTMVETLLKQGADANYKQKLGNVEMSLLILAVNKKNYKSVKLLVDHKAEVDWKDWFSTTALMYAANLGEINIIRYLLKNGADINAHDNQGNTVLSAAKEGNHPEVIKLIEDKLNKTN